MTETEFLSLAQSILYKIEDQAEQWFEEDDIDVDAVLSGHVLTLTFNRRSQVVINAQAPLQELWLASPTAAFHYRQQGDVWEDTRGGMNLADQLATQCSQLAGKSLKVEL